MTLDINKYRIAYSSQKHTAARRGIEFNLTFQEWCEFWGEDIERRGNGKDSLQMQRFEDIGPYALGNIRKGTPKQNSKTWGNMERKRNAEQAAIDLQSELDAAMNEPSAEPFDDDGIDPHYYNMGIKSSYRHRYFHGYKHN